MFDEQDQELGPVLTLVIGIAIAVSLFAIAIGLTVSSAFGPGNHASAAADRGTPTTRIEFAAGSSELPDTAGSALFMVVVATVVDATRRIELSADGGDDRDPAHDDALAIARMRAVRNALTAAGVAEARIETHRPVEPPAGAAGSHGVSVMLH